MVSRILFFRRGLLLTIALIFLASGMVAPMAQAYAPKLSKTEGDPGDGVLNPVAPSKDPDAVDRSDTSPTLLTQWAVGVRFVPIGMPGTQPGWGLWLILPNDWTRTPAFCFLTGRRDRNAP